MSHSNGMHAPAGAAMSSSDKSQPLFHMVNLAADVILPRSSPVGITFNLEPCLGPLKVDDPPWPVAGAKRVNADMPHPVQWSYVPVQHPAPVQEMILLYKRQPGRITSASNPGHEPSSHTSRGTASPGSTRSDPRLLVERRSIVLCRLSRCTDRGRQG